MFGGRGGTSNLDLSLRIVVSEEPPCPPHRLLQPAATTQASKTMSLSHPLSPLPQPSASSIWFSRHKYTPDQGPTTDSGRTGVRSQIICLQSLTEREVLELATGGLEGIWLEGIFIFHFKGSSYSICINTYFFNNVNRTGVLNKHKRVSLLTILLPRVMLSVFVENKGIWGYDNWNIRV